uniref:ABC transporter domain-containing protein n=1 Tax=Neovison vison TaxID=452646 RepID=A0A8C7A8Y8_NEOVI
MAFWTQLMLLLWKNFLYRRRQPVQLLVELLWPLFLFFILVAVRHSHPPLEHHECHFPNKPLPSAGTVPWLQGLICNLNNTCFPQPTPAEQPRVLSNFQDSLVSRLLADARTVLGGPSAHRTLASLGKLMSLLRAAGTTGEAGPSVWRGVRSEPQSARLCNGHRGSLGSVPDHAQESVSSFVEAAEDLAQELLALPSLVELRALLRRPQGAGGPLEAVSEALCSARGPSIPGGPSLNWYEASHLKELVGQEPAAAQPDHGLSPACAELVGSLESHPLSRLLWRRLKPLVLGKVLFTPNTAFTRQLMAQVNRTFQELALLKDVQEVWGVLGPQLFDFLNDSTSLAMMQRLLQAGDRGRRRPGSGGQAPAKALLAFLDPHGTHARALPQCVTLDKLEVLLAERRFWAGIVFLGPEERRDRAQPRGCLLYTSRCNLTGRNLSDFLVKTYPRLVRQGLKTKKWVNEVRYGGFSLGGRDPGLPSGQEVSRSVEQLRVLLDPAPGGALDRILNSLAAWAHSLDAEDSLKIWFNNKGWHAMVAFVNRANNAVLRAQLPPGPARRAHSITTLNHPLNLTKQQLSEAALVASSVDVLVSICVVFAMSFVPASSTLLLIEERITRAKHLQFMGGLPPTLYWLGSFLWDMCNYLVSACVVVLIFLAFQQRAYVAPANLPALLLLLLLYGWSITPLMYPASSFFSVPSTAYVVLTCVNLFIGINGSLATFVLELFSDQKLQDVSRILRQVFLIFPHFCLGRGLIDMVRNQAMADAFERLGDGQFQSPLRWEVVGKNLLAMAVQGPLFLLSTLLLQHGGRLLPQSPGSLHPLGDEDDDVARERERVVQGDTQGDVLVLRDLTKVCHGQRTPAVDRLCLGIPPGECFGLLGVNGAGKTSTFRMVTGDTLPSSGEATLAGHSVAREPAAAHRHMGYCPQSDAIFELLTGRQHLELFARLRGVPEAQVAQTATLGLERLGLLQSADQPAGTYSGGNKRKLATAVALVGDPAVVFLDEPTTGMDPSSRRFLWNSLLAVVREGRSVVLTSHSMEECEALCTRLAVVVNGRFRCLGSTQHLKNRFGAGHILTLRVPAARSESALALVATAFPGAELREAHGSRLRFQLPPGGRCALSRVFGELAARGAEHGVEDFSVSQTTLEEVFLNFSKDQGNEEDHRPEAGGQEGPAPRPQHPGLIAGFLEDPSMAESVP